MKQRATSFIRRLPFSPTHQEALLFALKMGYWPNLVAPRTFNEKINWRKLHSQDAMLVLCSDKIGVRNHVAERIGGEHLIPVLYTGDSITGDQLHDLGDNIVAKPTHDSKSTEIIRKNTYEIACLAASRIQRKLQIDYGKVTNQFAYSSIRPRVIVEKMLVDEEKGSPDDYKIFCFRQPDGSTKMFVERHEFREQPNYQVTWYDDRLEPILLRGSVYRSCPFPCPEDWPKMRDIAEKLAGDFDHVRIDLYRTGGKIYFGEMTFFDGGGRIEYSRRGGKRHDLDREMGDFWALNVEIPAESFLQNSHFAKAKI